MDMKTILAQSDPALQLAHAEVEQRLEAELNKPETETDCETMERCVALLAQMEGVALPEDAQIPPVIPPAPKDKGRRRTNTFIRAVKSQK